MSELSSQVRDSQAHTERRCWRGWRVFRRWWSGYPPRGRGDDSAPCASRPQAAESEQVGQTILRANTQTLAGRAQVHKVMVQFLTRHTEIPSQELNLSGVEAGKSCVVRCSGIGAAARKRADMEFAQRRRAVEGSQLPVGAERGGPLAHPPGPRSAAIHEGHQGEAPHADDGHQVAEQRRLLSAQRRHLEQEPQTVGEYQRRSGWPS